MKWVLRFCFFICVFNVALRKAAAHEIILPTLDDENYGNENFNSEEQQFLAPIVKTLQEYYDEILSHINQEDLKEEDANLKELLSEMFNTFINENDFLTAPFGYDRSLPTESDLNSYIHYSTSAEDRDMMQILQENIDDANRTIQTLIDQSNETEAMLLSINKIRIVKFLYKKLGNLFALGAKGARAAYCTYSHIPLINSTLIDGRAEIGSCYLYTRNSIVYLRSEVQSSINIIRGNVVELVDIYKKLASRESILGKLFTLLMNIQKIKDDIDETRTTANKTIEVLKTDIPTLVATSTDCATTSIPSFAKQLNETITQLVTCIKFVDDTTFGPEPEPESSEEDLE